MSLVYFQHCQFSFVCDSLLKDLKGFFFFPSVSCSLSLFLKSLCWLASGHSYSPAAIAISAASPMAGSALPAIMTSISNTHHAVFRVTISSHSIAAAAASSPPAALVDVKTTTNSTVLPSSATHSVSPILCGMTTITATSTILTSTIIGDLFVFLKFIWKKSLDFPTCCLFYWFVLFFRILFWSGVKSCHCAAIVFPNVVLSFMARNGQK